MIKLRLINSLMLFSCISLGINSGYAENIKRESLSSQDDIQIVNNIKALRASIDCGICFPFFVDSEMEVQ